MVEFRLRRFETEQNMIVGTIVGTAALIRNLLRCDSKIFSMYVCHPFV